MHSIDKGSIKDLAGWRWLQMVALLFDDRSRTKLIPIVVLGASSAALFGRKADEGGSDSLLQSYHLTSQRMVVSLYDCRTTSQTTAPVGHGRRPELYLLDISSSSPQPQPDW